MIIDHSVALKASIKLSRARIRHPCVLVLLLHLALVKSHWIIVLQFCRWWHSHLLLCHWWWVGSSVSSLTLSERVKRYVEHVILHSWLIQPPFCVIALTYYLRLQDILLTAQIIHHHWFSKHRRWFIDGMSLSHDGLRREQSYWVSIGVVKLFLHQILVSLVLDIWILYIEIIHI